MLEVRLWSRAVLTDDALILKKGFRTERIPVHEIERVELSSTPGERHLTVWTHRRTLTGWSARTGLVFRGSAAEALCGDLRGRASAGSPRTLAS